VAREQRGDELPRFGVRVHDAETDRFRGHLRRIFDALTSHRRTRPRCPPRTAARHLLKEAAPGKFNREHVDAFLSVVGMGAVAAF